jgi:hypothetical protein
MKKVSDHSDCILDRHFIWNLLGKWEPRSFNLSEKKQEEDLYRWLKSNLPEVPMIRQYGIGKGSADIIIQDSFLIELKLAFTDSKKTELDRCIGQLEHYKQKWVEHDRGPVYLVIVGDPEPEFRDILEKAIDRLGSGYLTQWFFLMIKKPKLKT